MLGVADRYKLGALLGVGGMGKVYSAEDANRTRVAVKVTKPELARDPAIAAMLSREARNAQRVSHPNVVRVIDHGVDAGAPYVVMALASGAPLGVMIQRSGPLPRARIERIVPQLLAGLAAIHRAGLVHGDVKSDNILVDDDDRVTIIDFGLARAPESDHSGRTQRELSGTPEYLAPELIRGEALTPSADLYGAAIILYEMLTGVTPFAGGSTAKVLTRHMMDPVPLPSQRDPSIPQALEAVLLRALDKYPSARYRDAGQLALAVAGALARTGGAPHVSKPSPHANRSAPTLPNARRRWARGTEPAERRATLARGPDTLVDPPRS